MNYFDSTQEDRDARDVREEKRIKNIIKVIVLGLVGVFVLTTILSMFENVQEGERGVVTKFDRVVRVAQPGMNTVIPFIYDIKPMSIRTTKLEVNATASSADLQDVTTKLAVQYNLIPTDDNVIAVFTEYKLDVAEILIAPAVQEAIKSATAKYTAVELITERQEVKKEIVLALQQRMAGEGIAVTNVDIIDFSFSKSFNQSIEAKVKAEQDALTAKNKLEQVKFEAQQAVEKAKAESEKTRLEVEALRSGGDDIILKIRAEAQLELAKKWNGVLPTQMIPNGAVPFLDLKY